MAITYRKLEQDTNISGEDNYVIFRQIKISKLKFQEILYREVFKCVSENKNVSNKIIKGYHFSQFHKWKLKYEEVKKHSKILDNVIKRMEHNLKENMSQQESSKCTTPQQQPSLPNNIHKRANEIDKDNLSVKIPKLITNIPNVSQKSNIKYILPSKKKYPPPYPPVPNHKSQPTWKCVPKAPNMDITFNDNKVTLTWDVKKTLKIAEIEMFELFVCKETDAEPDASMWIKIGDIKKEQYPMVCEIDSFEIGYTYYIALRAVDEYNRRAPFSVQKISIQ